MSGKNPEPLNVEPVYGYYISIDLQAGYRVGNAGHIILDAGYQMMNCQIPALRRKPESRSY